MELLGVRLVGVSQDTLTKLILTIATIAAVLLVRTLLVGIIRLATGSHPGNRVAFWTRQGASLASFALIVLGLASIWFDDPARLSTVAGLLTAGLAIAAQRAVTAFAGYLVIMRGKTFTVGDRIKMGGVRGDVIALGFLQTRILEMGQPPDVNEQETPGMWVRARQYSGRVVTVTNDKIFDEAVYNFTREFPYIWEEITIPIPYRGDRVQAERIMLEAARDATRSFVAESGRARRSFQSHYTVELDAEEPRAYMRLTDNWVELTVRFLVPEHGIREVKDQMSRRILREFDGAKIEVASGTYEIVGVPPIKVRLEPPAPGV
jgi:small-conductance mechanosensitive channel